LGLTRLYKLPRAGKEKDPCPQSALQTLHDSALFFALPLGGRFSAAAALRFSLAFGFFLLLAGSLAF